MNKNLECEFCALIAGLHSRDKPSQTWPFGSASSFGFPGAGGSLGFADPEAGVGYAYVTSQMELMWRSEKHSTALFSVSKAWWKDELHNDCIRS